MGEFVPLDAARKCRIELERIADLTQYTTPSAMDDLDDVRAALGYERLNLLGASYGTRAALVFLRRHPEHVRTVMLHGVAPSDQRLPLHFPHDTERALDGVLGECAAEEPCRSTFPDLPSEVKAVIGRLANAPVSVEIMHPRTGSSTTVRLSRDLAAEAIRYMLYSPASAGQIPSFVHAAAGGDFTPLAETALFDRQNIVASGSMGLYLSITCAEDLPFIKPGEGEREAAGTMLGDYRLKQQRAACGLWPRASLPPLYRRPVHSKVPVLIFSGAWDPVTPPANGAAVAKTLSRSLHVVVPHGGHSFEGLEGLDCLAGLEREFIERGTSANLDTRCIARIRRPPFPTGAPLMKPVAITAQEQARIPGSYRGQEQPVEVRFEVVEARLMLFWPDREPRLLVPVSPTEFRVVGAPFARIRFEPAQGRVRRAVLEQGGVPQLTLVPEPQDGKP